MIAILLGDSHPSRYRSVPLLAHLEQIHGVRSAAEPGAASGKLQLRRAWRDVGERPHRGPRGEENKNREPGHGSLILCNAGRGSQVQALRLVADARALTARSTVSRDPEADWRVRGRDPVIRGRLVFRLDQRAG